MKKGLIFLFLLAIGGCAAYRANIQPVEIDRIAVDKITADTESQSQVITNAVSNSLSRYFVIDQEASTRVSGSVIFDDSFWAPGYIAGGGSIILSKNGSTIGQIDVDPSWGFYDNPKGFANRIANILKKYKKSI